MRCCLLLIVLASAYAHDFKTCGADKLAVASVVVTPDSPIPGANLTVTFTGTPTQDIVVGDKLTINIKVFGVVLGHVDFDFCKDLGVTCPVKAGTATKWDAVYLIPKAAPGGVPLTAECTAQSVAGVQYSCVDVPVVMGKPPQVARRSLVEPIEDTVYDLSHLTTEMRSFIDQTEHLKALVKLAESDPASLAEMVASSPLAQIASAVTVGAFNAEANGTVPLVVAHGMGDSCFNPGMMSITKAAGNRLGVYSTCIPTAKTQIGDTIDGFLKNMDKSVDFFAAKVKADPKLANGFDAFGLSQGNNVIRGYITKYNNPPVRNFMSICGINAGVGAFPACSPQIPVAGAVCKALTEVLGVLAYNPLSQGILFQADYFRDPSKVNNSGYLKHSQLAAWNNEGSINQDYKDNWAKTSKFVMVKGTEDTVVWPREGEWWGAMSEQPGKEFSEVDVMKNTRWYNEDLFGLKTADEAGKIFFESFKGQHIRMTEQELFGWLDKYFKNSAN